MPSAIVAVAYKLLPESPRFLNVMKRHDEAMKVECHRQRLKLSGAGGSYFRREVLFGLRCMPKMGR